MLCTCALLGFSSCEDEKTETGTLVIRYQKGNWTPQKLFLFFDHDRTNAIRVFTGTDFETVSLELPVGRYLLRKSDGNEIRLTVSYKETTRIYYSKNKLVVEGP